MKHFLHLFLLGLLLSTCKPFLERKVMLLTLPVEEKNDSTLILKAHLIDYNPKKPIREFGFMVSLGDSSQLQTFSKKVSTQNSDSCRVEFLTLHYTDEDLLFKNPNPINIEPKKVFVKSYVLQENDELIWGNLQEIELNWGSIANISSTSTSITFDYVIDWGEDCDDIVANNYGLIEYGFFYHSQPNPSESSHIGKITEFLGDDFLLACLAGDSQFLKSFRVQNLQPRTTYYFRYYTKINGQTRYGQTFSATTQ